MAVAVAGAVAGAVAVAEAATAVAECAIVCDWIGASSAPLLLLLASLLLEIDGVFKDELAPDILLRPVPEPPEPW